MAYNGAVLELDRCPHCGVARPCLDFLWKKVSAAHSGRNVRMWCVYGCSTCGGFVLTAARGTAEGAYIDEMWPQQIAVSSAVPDRAREYLEQALASLHAPAGAVMLAASAVDAMLKDKGLTAGSLYSRIDKAASDHLITSEMAAWAHEVRLEANGQRHADESADMPTEQDAERVIQFAQALAEFLFVLPALVARGREAATDV